MKFREMINKIIKKSCRHDYKPIKFASVTNDEYGRAYYYYQVQCMLCGRTPFLMRKYRDKQLLYLPFKESILYKDNLYVKGDFKMNEKEKIIVGTNRTGKSRDIGTDIKIVYSKEKIKRVLENDIHIVTSLTAQQIDEIVEIMVHELQMENCGYIDLSNLGKENRKEDKNE